MSIPQVEVVILAGGAGTRLWPLSRRDQPKPLIRVDGGATLLERTWERAARLAPPESIWVAAPETLLEPIRRQLPGLRRENCLVEEVARDTGPAAVYAAWEIERRRPGAVLMLLPADHLVARPDRFVEAIIEASRVALREDALVCLAVPASRPSSAYGYLEFGAACPGHGRTQRLVAFREKPAPEQAAELLRAGRTAWNAGIFVWRTDRFLEEVRGCSPELSRALKVLASDGPGAFFRAAPSGPVDRLVLERSARVFAVGADMGWDDVGTWPALAAHLPGDDEGNRGLGDWVAVESSGCVVHSATKPVVLLGVQDLVVVERDDVLLVAHRGDPDLTRRIPDLLEARGLGRLR